MTKLDLGGRIKNTPARIITQYRKTILFLFLLLAAVGAAMLPGVSVNYNIADYLPQDAASTEALSVMRAEFTQAIPNARVMVRDVSVREALEYKRGLQAIDGVSDVLWLDDVTDVDVPVETIDPKISETYYKDGNALISLSVREGDEVAITERIRALIGETGALSGNAADRADAQALTGKEAIGAVLILVPIIILILMLSTSSWFEPLLYLCAIGISVLINMGTNLFLGEVSFITNAVSPILQLAVSLDYAIFLLHSFDEQRKRTDDAAEAMRRAMRRAFPSVAAAAATTVLSFVALAFMRFGIGADLGLNLVKGVLLSFAGVMIFLPALTLSCYKLIDRTRRRNLLSVVKGASKYIPRFRIPALILIAALILPCFLAQENNAFTYGFGNLNENGAGGRDAAAIDEAFGRSNVIVLLTPADDPAGAGRLADDCRALPHVKEVVSYTATVGADIPSAFPDRSDTQQFFSDRYSRTILYTDAPSEGAEAFALVESARDRARAIYGNDWYALGESVTLYDMKDVVTKDNRLVNILAVVAIFVVLLITFRSLSLPFLLLFTIQSAIWINLSVSYFTGNPLSYIGYLVISTVQLGATVDYAILLSDHYLANRKNLPKKEALEMALKETIPSILVSAGILSLAGFTLWFSSSNPIVSAMGLLLGRGTALSCAMVFCFLPALLTVFDRVIEKTTLRAAFSKLKSKNTRVAIPLLIALISAVALTGCGADAQATETIDAIGQGDPIPAIATEPGTVSGRDEVIYANLTADGDVRDVYAVNTLHVSKAGEIVDRGNYTDEKNLTSDAPLRRDGDRIAVSADTGDFAYQGTMIAPRLPWDIRISYTLNGEELSPDELAGRSGRLSLRLTAEANADADPAFCENYLLQISVALDSAVCKNIVSDGTVARAGKDKIVAGVVMPGRSGHLAIDADVTDFSMTGIEMSAMPPAMRIDAPDTEAFTGDLSALTEATDALREGAEALKDGAAALKDGAAALESGSKDYAAGLNNLDESARSLVAGSARIGDALGKLSGALTYVSPEFAAETAALDTGYAEFHAGLVAYTEGVSALANAYGTLDAGVS
ncbi:MAG: MMPL family transporter, partial [Clostridiales Family XIII bacterium]|nr:MMPL family transporter [Clostridiales Family XIII bacterium]